MSEKMTSVAFDFSSLGEFSGQAVEADQQFDLHYGTAQDEYLISCIYLAKIHALTAKAGRYGGGTWTKWYESKGLSHGSATNMVQTGKAFKSSTIDDLKQLPELTRKDLNLIARSGYADQIVAAAGNTQQVQELLSQLKAETQRANDAETRLKNSCIAEQNAQEALQAAESDLNAALADVNGLSERNAELEKQLEGSRQVAKAATARADKYKAEAESARKAPIEAVVDEEEVDRRAAEKAYQIAADMNADLNAKLADTAAAAETDVRNAYDSVLLADRSIQNSWKMVRASFSKLPTDQRETLANMLVRTLGQIQGEVTKCL